MATQPIVTREGVVPDRRIASLDGLRSISIALVLLVHLYGTAGFPVRSAFRVFHAYAHLGVQIFFVISGFLITTLLIRERERRGRIDLPAFFKRRTLRILPAMFVYVSIVALLTRPGLAALAYAYSYTMCYTGQARPWQLGHLWSLSVEEQFYLVWPLAMALAFSHRRRIGLGVMLVSPLLRFVFWKVGLRDIDEYFPTVADSLMAGCLLACYRDVLLARAAWLTRPTIFAALALFTISAPWLFERVAVQIFLGGLLPAAIALLVHAAVERRDAFLNNRSMTTVGALSYPLYLCQQPFLDRTSSAWWAAFPSNIVLAVVFALLLHHLVERPFLRLSRPAEAGRTRATDLALPAAVVVAEAEVGSPSVSIAA